MRHEIATSLALLAMTSFPDYLEAKAQELGFEPDRAQLAVAERFESLAKDLLAAERLDASPLLRMIIRRREVRGLYLWGGVGRGKSFLMDSFFAYAPVARKERIHFHRFMQRVHHELHRLQGEADPLAAIAREFAHETRLLCLDEFHTTDITDAMLMRRFLEVLLENGVVLVTTSNFAPDALYQHGLQRTQFLPAIELIKTRLDVINVDQGTDYRLRELEQAGVYHTEADSENALRNAFNHIAGDAGSGAGALEIEGRMIHVKCEARGVAWFDFAELCETARGKADYIELARRYHTVIVSNVPRFTGANGDALRRFVWMIDEFYDRRVKLVVSAAAPPEDLIGEADEGDKFQANLAASLRERLVSRLTEMHTRDYLSQAHLA